MDYPNHLHFSKPEQRGIFNILADSSLIPTAEQKSVRLMNLKVTGHDFPSNFL
jgi:hypothetical protein